MTYASQAPVALVADDHELFRAGAAAMLVRDCGFGSVLEAGTLDEALRLLDEQPWIALASFDLGMPGVGNPICLRQIRERYPQIRLVVVTGSERRDNILMALQSGVHGYVPKTLGIAEIARALQIIMGGGIYVPQAIAELPAALEPSALGEIVPSEMNGAHSAEPPDFELTKRQRDVLRLIRSGRSNKEIGWRLGLSENTVKVHTNALYKKLRVHNRFQAANLDLSLLDAADGKRSHDRNGRDMDSSDKEGDKNGVGV